MDIQIKSLLASVIVAGLVTVISVIVLRPLANRIGLVDCPGGRKQHEGQIPLIGGIAVFIGMMAGIAFSGTSIPHANAFMAAISLLLVTGVIDDYLDVPAIFKLIVQVGAALIMVYWGGLRIDGLSNLFASGSFYLGVLSAPFTILAVVGYINAINMSDGIDGLAGSLTLVSAVSLLYAALNSGLVAEAIWLAVLAAAIVVFLLFNARHPLRAKVGIFLGDGGSLLCGIVIAWFVVHLATVRPRSIDAATALWIVGVPFIDMIAVMFKRILRGKSPFAADREHFHHLLLTAGFSVNKTVMCIAGLALLFAAIGLAGQYSSLRGPAMFYLFVGVFCLALLLLNKAWQVKKLLRKVRAVFDGPQ